MFLFVNILLILFLVGLATSLTLFQKGLRRCYFLTKSVGDSAQARSRLEEAGRSGESKTVTTILWLYWLLLLLREEVTPLYFRGLYLILGPGYGKWLEDMTRILGKRCSRFKPLYLGGSGRAWILGSMITCSQSFWRSGDDF